MKNSVFIATSIDGYIADSDGGLDWLQMVPNPEHNDAGYSAFMETVDALVMGRNTYETVLGFGIDWPYNKPVFVLSSTLKEVTSELKEKVFIVNGELQEVLQTIHKQGFENLYIDGGKTIQSFLQEDLIDELILTTIPVLLGGGTNLFGALQKPLAFTLAKTEVYIEEMVQRHYVRS
ncbi:dihydrofolate reductase family protein [Wenyingzhuangia sp. IMCC45574]